MPPPDPLPPTPGDAPGLSRRSALRALGWGALAAPFAAGAAAAQQAPPAAECLPDDALIEELWRRQMAGSIPQASRPQPEAPPEPAPDLASEPLREAPTPPEATAAPTLDRPLIKPPRLRPGALLALVAPAGRLDSPGQLASARRSLEMLGFRTRPGRYVLRRNGYLAGTDQERADDVMEAFLDPDVDGVVALRGGWGCARFLPLLDFEAIRDNPKPLVGFSDITALLLAIYVRSGLVTFHGPVGRSRWNSETVASFRRVLMEGGRLTLEPEHDDDRRYGYTPLRPGISAGPLVGGNLSVVSALVGTPYLPSFDDHIVFFEEVREDVYRIDRMITQLKLAGAFDQARGVVFGSCRGCSSGGAGAGALEWMLREQFAGGRAPAWTGAPIGHISPVHTLPIGTRVISDAGLGTLAMTEPAVA